MDSCSPSPKVQWLNVFSSIGFHISPILKRYGCDFKWPVFIYHSSDCKLYEGRVDSITACASGLISVA